MRSHADFRNMLLRCYADVHLQSVQSENPRAIFVIIHSLLMEMSSFDWALRKILTFSTKATSICGVCTNRIQGIKSLNWTQNRSVYVIDLFKQCVLTSKPFFIADNLKLSIFKIYIWPHASSQCVLWFVRIQTSLYSSMLPETQLKEMQNNICTRFNREN